MGYFMKRLYCLGLSVLCLSTVLSIYAAKTSGCGNDRPADYIYLKCNNNSTNHKNTSTAGSVKSQEKGQARGNATILKGD